MVKAFSPNATIRRFEGVLIESGERMAINLEKAPNGVLNGIKIEANERPVYNYICKNGIDKSHATDKIKSFCEKVKDGAKLFKEIMEAGLNIKK